MNILDVGIPAHALLSTTHSDTLAAAVARGALIVGNATPAWALLTIGSVGKVLQSDGTDANWATPSGSGLPLLQTSPTIVTPTIASFVNSTHSHLNAAGGGTITAAAISDLATAAVAFSNKTGNISQWTNDTGYLTSVTAHNLLSATHGDTLADSVVRGDILYGNSTPKWARLAKPSVLSGLSHDGTDVSWVTATGTGAPVRGTAPVFPTSITLGAASGATGTALFKGTTSGTVTLSVADAAGTWTMKLPTSAGSNTNVLQTDGSGNTSWVAAGGSSGITIGTTTITSGTTTRILYDNAGVVGEYTITGTGTVVAMQTAPALKEGVTIDGTAGKLTITGPGTAGTAIARFNPASGASFVQINDNGTMVVDSDSGTGTKPQSWKYNGTEIAFVSYIGEFQLPTINILAGLNIAQGNLALRASSSDQYIDFKADTFLRRGWAAATLQMGADVNGAAANQQLQACNGITGTDKTGGTFTLASGKGTGAGAVSSLIFQTPTVLGSGTAAQSLATRLTIVETLSTFTNSVSALALTMTGNQSAAAWTTSGIRLKGTSGTLTDTTSTGTVAAAYTNKLGGNTIAASSATTYTNYISSYFSDPVAGTNVTFTNK